MIGRVAPAEARVRLPISSAAQLHGAWATPHGVSDVLASHLPIVAGRL